MAMGLFQILKQAFTAVPTFDDLNDEFYDGLEEALILADVGAETACDIVAQLRKRVKERFLGRMEEVKDALRDILRSKLEVGDSALTLEGKPAVVLVIGVNGVGKTTSIGKLAKQLKSQGKKVLLCAGDTFRAAAADQLEIWSQRAGVDIVRQNEGADPGAVLFDALQAAKARGTDVVLCDTAGRLHNKKNLMQELAKINRIIDNRKRGKRHHIIINAEGIGHSASMAKRIEAATGIETRATILGYMQRGGAPTCKDRVYASIMGAKAVELLEEGKTNRVVAYKHGEFLDFDIQEALNMKKDIPEEQYEIAKLLASC